MEGVHVCDCEVWIENVRMYCNRGCLFCVSGFYSELSRVFIPNLVEYLFRTQSSIYLALSIIFSSIHLINLNLYVKLNLT